LASAASGRRLPTLAVTLAYVGACGGNKGRVGGALARGRR
jgi:hypothetical protein